MTIKTYIDWHPSIKLFDWNYSEMETLANGTKIIEINIKQEQDNSNVHAAVKSTERQASFVKLKNRLIQTNCILENEELDLMNNVQSKKVIKSEHCLKGIDDIVIVKEEIEEDETEVEPAFYIDEVSDSLSSYNNQGVCVIKKKKLLECDTCHKTFSRGSRLKNHMKIHIDKKIYECSICHKTCTHPGNYKQHLKIHTDQKLHECDVCHKTFTQVSSCNEHKKIHTGEKPYECVICQKAFIRNQELERHMRLHSNEKPFECTICHKRFNQASNCTIHMRIHTGERPYECDICHKTFTQIIHLKRHMTTHTDKK